MMQDIQALSKIAHLADLSLANVSALADVIEVIEAQVATTIIEEGDVDDSIFIVLEGEVETRSSASGQPHALGRHSVGDFVGLISMIDGAPRFASVQTVGKARLGRISRVDYQKLARENADLSLAFQRALSSQLAKDFRSINDLLQTELAALPASAPTAAPAKSSSGDVDCDVAVLGGGPMGMIYAQWIKRMRPETNVVLVERREVPGYKVGESTLSTTVRAFLAMGFTMPQMRRLFGNKAGIRFWWAGPDSTQPEQECDITDLEETFQIERRVFEIALQRLTREKGIDIRVGTNVEIEDSVLDGDIKSLACTGPDGKEYMLKTRIVCDATGPAAVIPRHLETYRKEPALHDTFQTNCYFAYFKQKKQVPVRRWQEAATRHLCTPQGWVWFITVHSWESADDETVTKMVNDVMDHDSDDDSQVPPRKYFQEKHGAYFELITSIGITVREDMDTAKELPIQKRFEHYVERYPALKWILSHYELVEKPYREKRRPHAAFLGLAHDSTQVAGDGWVAIGDSAQFSNPFFSHGINYGSGTSYMAAVDTVKALNEGNFTKSAFDAYSQYGAELYPVLVQETDMYYRSWAHPLAFEQTMQAKFHWGAVDVLQLGEYSDRDPYVFDPLNDKWKNLIRDVRTIEKKFEAENGDALQMAHDIRDVIEPFNAQCRVKAAELGVDFNAVLNNFDGNGVRVEDKTNKPRAYFKAYNCPTCKLWQDDVLASCPSCGTPNPDQYTGVVPTVEVNAKKKQIEPLTSTAAAPSEPAPLPKPTIAGSSKKRHHELRVASVVDETADSKSFNFEVPDELSDLFNKYEPGQFLTFEVDVDGEVLKRAYSISSAPSVDAQPSITIKRVSDGRVSNWICDNIHAGSVLKVLPPSGRFTVPDKEGDLFLFAAGSGVTAVLSIAKEFLAKSERQVRLVYVNRSKEETIFLKDIEALKAQYGRRFKIKHRVGRAEGRLDTRDVQAYCDELTEGLYYMCGPWGFMDVVEEGLLDMGVAPERIHVERFASPKATTKPAPDETTASAAEAHAGQTITMDVFGESVQVPYAGGEYLTQAAEAVGVDVPCSCEEGFCGTCVARVVEGSVEMDVEDALSKGQKKRGLILACQARPTSEKLVIAFES